MYLFEPTQLKSFVNASSTFFHEGQGFEIKFEKFNRYGGLFKNITVPFGPNCSDFEGFKKAIQYLETSKFTKIKIDLPLVLDSSKKEAMTKYLKSKGYRISNYFQDEETLLVSKENFALNSRNLRYVRQGEKNHTIIIKEKLTERELEDIYTIYCTNAKIIGYAPKSLAALEEIMKNGIVALAVNNTTQTIEGFLMGYKNQYLLDSELVLQLIFTGLTENGKSNKLGFALHYRLFEESFQNKKVKFIDFHGASRMKGRTYTAFKQNFGGEFIAYPGSFEKIQII